MKNPNLDEISRAIDRFSNFAKWWSSVNLIILSSFFIGMNLFIKNIDTCLLKISLLLVYLITVLLCNIMAINYLSLEKAARNEYNKLVKNDTEKINWKNVKVRPYFFTACKSWSIKIPLLIYLGYFIFLVLVLFS